jgi:hypothetical protein
MNERNSKNPQDHEDLGESPTMEYVRELVRNLDPEINIMDPDDAPTVKI